MEKEHVTEAQITIPAASSEQEVRWEAPQHFEQPQLESADGIPIAWPGQKPQATTRETSVFLRTLEERGVAVTVAKQLQQENSDLAVKAEKYDRYRQKSKDSYARQKEADPEGLREKERVRKARQRERQRQEAQVQESNTSR